jgi:hypothetical protein
MELPIAGLHSLKVTELIKLAATRGIEAELIDRAMDAPRPKGSLLDLLRQHQDVGAADTRRAPEPDPAGLYPIYQWDAADTTPRTLTLSDGHRVTLAAAFPSPKVCIPCVLWACRPPLHPSLVAYNYSAAAR